LDSVAEQTLASTALIVVDDASTDRGPDRVMAWMETHQDRLASASLVQHASNRGLAAARNTAVERSESEYVFILDADNEIRPRCLEALLTSARSSGAAFAYSIIEQFGEIEGLAGTDAWSAERLARGNYVDAMALLKRTTWKAVGGYRKMTTPGWEDFDFWCRCVEADLHGILVPEILCRYRLHSRSMLRRFIHTLSQHSRVRSEVRSAHPWVEL
jgi:glycosyltransferase involved in cell wall biosynthesis